MLARELQELTDQYNRLVESVSSGALSIDDALRTLDALTATDSAGLVWRLDMEGRFLCGGPSEVPQPADPQRFSARSVPGPWDSPPSFDATPSFASTPTTGPSFAVPVVPAGSDEFASSFNPSNAGWSPTLPSASAELPSSTKSRKSRRKSSHALPSLTSKISSLGPGALRTPLIVVVAVGAALWLWSSSGSDKPSGTTIPVTEQNQPSTTAPATPSGQTSGQTGTDKERVDQLLAELGDVTVDPSAVIAEPGEGSKLLLRRAQFAGYAAVGLTVRVSDLVAVDGGYRCEIVLGDTKGGVVVRGSVDVVTGDDGLLLADWPVFGK